MRVCVCARMHTSARTHSIDSRITRACTHFLIYISFMQVRAHLSLSFHVSSAPGCTCLSLYVPHTAYTGAQRKSTNSNMIYRDSWRMRRWRTVQMVEKQEG